MDIGAVARARVAGAAFLLLGIGFAVAAVVVWNDPTALTDGPFPMAAPTGKIVLGVIGAVIFGGIGMTTLIRADRAQR